MMEDKITGSCLPDSSLGVVDFRGARNRVDPDGSISTSFSSGSSFEVIVAVGRIRCPSVSRGRGGAPLVDSRDISRQIGL